MRYEELLDDLLKVKVDLGAIRRLVELQTEYYKRHPNQNQEECFSIKYILSKFPLKIKDLPTLLQGLRKCAELRADWNISELSQKLGVTRQTIYNWKKYNYLIWHNDKIDVIRTSEFWELLRTVMQNTL